MREKVDSASCGRENDLIGFLYGELDSSESTVFRNHMQKCQSCAAELAEFSNIRESVVTWRNEALEGVTSPAFQTLPVSRSNVATPGALTALREFFNLSPLWMKGTVVFASLLFCVFAVLAVARLRETPPPVANNSSPRSYTQQELDAAVERRVKEELQANKKSSEPTPDFRVVVEHESDPVFHKRSINSQIAVNGPRQKARRPLSKIERQELAADLRLIDNPTDGELDLLDDRINQ